MMQSKKTARLGAGLVGAALMWATSANASLIGDSVEAAMSGGLFIETQFVSPQVVGAGVEFSGGIRLSPGDPLSAEIQVDVSDSGFTVGGLNTSTWGGHGGLDSLRIDLTNLDWLGQPGEIIGINDLGGSHLVQELGFGPHSAFVIFSQLSFGASVPNLRAFSFDVRHDAPEPGALALFGVGLIGLGLARRRRRAA